MNASFFTELLQSISDRGRALLDRGRERRDGPNARSETLADLCEELLSRRGEASGVALAREILGRYAELTTGPASPFSRFSPTGSDPTGLASPKSSPRGNAIRPRKSPRSFTWPPSPVVRNCSGD